MDMDIWQETNRQALITALNRVRGALERYAGRETLAETVVAHHPRPVAEAQAGDVARQSEPEGMLQVTGSSGVGLSSDIERRSPGLERLPSDLKQISPTLEGPSSALERLCAMFGLSSFERDVLVLCAGVELEASFASLVAEIQSGRLTPTFGLALAALPEAHWSALAPSAPLRRWHLLELTPADTIPNSPIRLAERILHFLTGVYYLDERLEGVLVPAPAVGDLPPTHQELADEIVRRWSQTAQVPPVILLGGDPLISGAGLASKVAIASNACRQLGLGLYRMLATDIPLQPGERELLARLWEREAALGNYALLLDGEELDGGQTVQALVAFAETLRSPVLMAVQSTLPDLQAARPAVRLDIRRPSLAEQRPVWQKALGPAAAGLDGSLDMLITQFDLSAQAISAAVSEGIGGRSSSISGQALTQSLWDACRRQARPRLESANTGHLLAQRIESIATWDDLVLPDIQHQALLEITAQVRQRAQVYETWGMAAKNNRGLGISALFAGPSGTGKTLAAEVLANELRLDLYRIDLSSVVNKYIGETEKNLRRVFDAAEGSGAILLFDEADALFGKRSEVKDSHDRYANVEISYLLQRMETYRGLAILTSNLKSAIDPAFLRRIRFIVNFPFPDTAQRAEIWKRMFPPQVPTEGLDPARLAKLNVAGGNIRNIALNAAFLAAEAGEPVRMSHLLRAARSEYSKLEKTPTEAEIGGWL